MLTCRIMNFFSAEDSGTQYMLLNLEESSSSSVFGIRNRFRELQCAECEMLWRKIRNCDPKMVVFP